MIVSASQEIDLVFEGLGVAGSIYISNYAAAINPETLQKLGIRAVITVARGLLLPHSKDILPNYLYLPIDDNEEQQILRMFQPTNEFLEKNRIRCNVLVHCFSGVSRSAAFIAAYLMRKYGYTVNQAISLMRRKKKRINPNRSFMRQLQQYHKELQKEKTNKITSNTSIEEDCHKKEQLINQLLAMKKNSQKIEHKILEVRNKLESHEVRKRSKSQYLKKRIQQRSSSRKGSVCETPRKTDRYLDVECLKSSLHCLRSTFS